MNKESFLSDIKKSKQRLDVLQQYISRKELLSEEVDNAITEVLELKKELNLQKSLIRRFEIGIFPVTNW